MLVTESLELSQGELRNMTENKSNTEKENNRRWRGYES